MTDKAEIIRQICQMSEEKPEFLANFSKQQLFEYMKHIKKQERKRALVSYQK